MLEILTPCAALRTRFRTGLMHGDVADRDLVFKLFEEEKPDIVVNFAAGAMWIDRSRIRVFLRTNVIGTQVLLDAAREYGVRRFHQVIHRRSVWRSAAGSTGSVVYGRNAFEHIQSYSASKAGGPAGAGLWTHVWECRSRFRAVRTTTVRINSRKN